MVIIMWALILLLIIVSAFLIEPKHLRTLSHYTNLGVVNYYLNARWWHAIIFPASGVIFGFFWTILTSQLFVKRGALFARAFVFLSYFVLVTLSATAVRILLFNAGLS